MAYEIPAGALDPRPGDLVLVHRDGAWQVLTVRDAVAVERLLAFGERGSRAFVRESLQLDSVSPEWRDEVLLLVDLHPDRFGSSAEARAGLTSGRLAAPLGPLMIPAASLTEDTAELVGGDSGQLRF